MSSTRHAAPDRPLSQERYLSSPEYAELRGISGNAVTTKAELLAHAQKRSLLFFLQAMSLKPGGLKQFSRDFLEHFRARIGTPTMHRAGMKPGKVYTAEITHAIKSEMAQMSKDGWYYEPDCKPLSVEVCIELCRDKMLLALTGFLIELCINPKLFFPAPGETPTQAMIEEESIDERFEDEGLIDGKVAGARFAKAELSCFQDVVGALFKFQQQYAARVRADFVMTEIGSKVFETLDVTLTRIEKKMVVVEGESGIGKTVATESWCEQHLGEARFVSLSGITHKTGIFRAIARALGIGSSFARSSTEVQTRIEDILQRSRLVLVLDEAHFLFSSSERVYSRPELIDWIDTALYNHRVSVALVVTPQFAVRMDRVAKQTTWNADQLKRRVKRWTPLPIKPSRADMEAVARKLLPEGGEASIKLLVGYALSYKMPMPAIVDAIDEARLLAQRERREKVTFDLLERAIADYTSPSYNAMQRSFEAPGRRSKAPRLPRAAADGMADEPGAIEQPAPPPSTRRKTNLTGLTPVSQRSVSPSLVESET